MNLVYGLNYTIFDNVVLRAVKIRIIINHAICGISVADSIIFRHIKLHTDSIRVRILAVGNDYRLFCSSHAAIVEAVVALVAVQLGHFVFGSIKYVERIISVSTVNILILNAYSLNIYTIAENSALRNDKVIVAIAADNAHLV